MSIEADHLPCGPNPTPVSIAQRWEIMTRVRSFFRTTPKYDELATRFGELLEHRDYSAGWTSGHAPGMGTDMAAVPYPAVDGAVGPGDPGRLDGRSEAGFRESDTGSDETVAEDCHDAIGSGDRPRKCPEGLILVLTGETGSGKSEALDMLFWANRERLGDTLISIGAPSPCTLKQLGRDLLPRLGYPLVRDKDEHLVWEDVRRQLNGRKGLIIHFDEFQHLPQQANIDQRRRILNTIKSLVQRRDNPVQLVLSGGCELADFLQTDGQVARRCRFVELERLNIALDILPIACTIEDLVRRSPLKIEESVANDVAARLIHAANYALGRAIELACDAIEVALRVGDASLARPHFEKALYNRISCPRSRNAFVVDNWKEIDPTLILNRKKTVPEPAPPRKRRARDGRS